MQTALSPVCTNLYLSRQEWAMTALPRLGSGFWNRGKTPGQGLLGHPVRATVSQNPHKHLHFPVSRLGL